MYLIEIFLPLSDNNGVRFARSEYEGVEEELSLRYGGVTSYPRAPAAGIWKTSETEEQKDDLIVYEVMANNLDVDWWSGYRTKLEQIFRQEKILVRAQTTQLL
jgi:hypothetical protein